MKMSDIKITLETRQCIVDGKPGLFHCWEQYSQPIAGSLLVGGAPDGIFSRVYGIVEFSDGVRRVEVNDIRFVDDQNDYISIIEKEKVFRKNETE